jgi:Aspartyl protease
VYKATIDNVKWKISNIFRVDVNSSCIVAFIFVAVFRLLRLLDQRYRGVAIGVGQSEILGRIHVAPIKVLFPLGSFLRMFQSNNVYF